MKGLALQACYSLDLVRFQKGKRNSEKGLECIILTAVTNIQLPIFHSLHRDTVPMD